MTTGQRESSVLRPLRPRLPGSRRPHIPDREPALRRPERAKATRRSVFRQYAQATIRLALSGRHDTRVPSIFAFRTTATEQSRHRAARRRPTQPINRLIGILHHCPPPGPTITSLPHSHAQMPTEPRQPLDELNARHVFIASGRWDHLLSHEMEPVLVLRFIPVATVTEETPLARCW